MFPNLKCDYRREANKTGSKNGLVRLLLSLWSLGFQAVLGYRLCRWLVKRRIPFIHIFIRRHVELFTGISLPPAAVIGKGLLIEHFGGIVVNAQAVIGENCTLSHQVTIGNKHPGGKAPVIGNNVYVCVGAKILGDITIGDNCIIGAGAVVLESMPANSVIAGVPAKVVKKTG
jgi:serine O-acetyltransferase